MVPTLLPGQWRFYVGNEDICNSLADIFNKPTAFENTRVAINSKFLPKANQDFDTYIQVEKDHVTRFPTTPKQINTTLNTKVRSNQPCNQWLLLVAIACERLTNWITVNGLIGEVFKRICIVHTFAASSGSNVRAMDLFENNLVSAFGHETRI